MAVKKVSISNLPVATRSEVDASLFMASTRAPGSTTMQSKQLSYGELYSKIISDVRADLGLNSAVGSDTKPIYVNSSKMFSASTKNIGGIADTADYGKTFTPIYMKNGELCASNINVGGCSYNGHTCTPIYMNNGALRPATSPIGSNTQPIYMDRGTLKESNYSSEPGVAINANQTPIVMTNGQISKMQPSIGKSVTNDVQPIYVNNGRMTSIGNSVGSATNPIYINDSGHIVPGNTPLYEVNFPPTGNLNTPIFINDDGEFAEAQIIERDAALMLATNFNILQTVLFINTNTSAVAYQTKLVTETSDDPTAEFRLAWGGNSQPVDGKEFKIFRGADKPVAFRVPKDGWYIIHAEAGCGGVGFGINTYKIQPGQPGYDVNKHKAGWYHYHPYFTSKTSANAKIPNLIYWDRTERASVCAMFHLAKDVEIGVYSKIRLETNKNSNCQWNSPTWTIAEYSQVDTETKRTKKYPDATLYTINESLNGYVAKDRGSLQYPLSYSKMSSNMLNITIPTGSEYTDPASYFNSLKGMRYSYYFNTNSITIKKAIIKYYTSGTRYRISYEDANNATDATTYDPYRKINMDGINAWSSSKTYSVGNKVKRNSRAFECISAVKSSTAPANDSTHWKEITYTEVLTAINRNDPYSQLWFDDQPWWGSGSYTVSQAEAKYNEKKFWYVISTNLNVIGITKNNIDDIDYMSIPNNSDNWGNKDIVELISVS